MRATPRELSALNVDLTSATSIVIGVAEGIVAHREQMAKLPAFDVRHVDKLVDYAKAAWFVYVTNLPAAEPDDSARLFNEVAELRAKLLIWAAPLASAGQFDEAAVAKIRAGSGSKDMSSDLVALVQLYRSKWDEVKNMCGVTEDELNRGAVIGPAMFGLVSRRENQATTSISDASLRVRRAWTLLDRAYTQCRRALSFLRFEEGDADTLAPSLRRNLGPRATSAAPAPASNTSVQPVLTTNGSSGSVQLR